MEKKFISILLVAVLAAGALSLLTRGATAGSSDGFALAVDKDGNIRMPDVDYRKDWVAIGSWAIAAEEGTAGSQGLHIVYTQPSSVAAYRKTGVFPDGSILIKELFEAATDKMTTGTVSRATKRTGWFVMIKDTTGRYPDHKLWGDGWGWAFFDAADPAKTKSTDYKADCLGCHVPAQGTDWVYVQGYPVLSGR